MRILSLLPLAVFLPAPLIAATYTWDGGGTNNYIWHGPNWVGDSVPPVDGSADFVFAGSTRPTPELDGTFPVDSITFASGAASFTINHAGSIGTKRFDIGANGITQADNSTQTLNTDIKVTASHEWHADAGTLNIGSSGTSRVVDLNGSLVTLRTDSTRYINIHSRLQGSGNLTKQGLGIATLYNNSNSWSGATTVNGGILRLGAHNALSANSSLNITSTGRFDLNGYDTTALWLAGSGQLDLGGRSFTVGDSSSRTYSGVIEGTGGSLIKQGSGTLTLDNAQITSGTEYWAKDGVLAVQNSLGTSPVLRINPGATIDVNPVSSLSVSGLWGAGTVNLNQKDLIVDIGTGGLYFFNGTLLGGANADFHKQGDGKLVLGDADTYTGEIRVENGTLGFIDQNLFDAFNPLGKMIVSPPGMLELDGTQQTFYNLSGGGEINLDGGQLRLVGGQAVGDSKTHTVNVTGTGDLLFRDPSSTPNPNFPDINFSNSSFINFTGSMIFEEGVVKASSFATRPGDSTDAVTIDLRSNGGFWSDSGFDVLTMVGDGTLYTTNESYELLGDGGSHTFSGRIFPFFNTTLDTATITIRNQSWTFDGRIVQNNSKVHAVIAGDASASFRTASNGDIAIPDSVLVESGGNAGFVLNSTSTAWELRGPSGINPTSGTAAINAINNALATVTLDASFNNTLLVATSNGGRVRLLQGGGLSSVLLTGSGDVELGGNLTLDSLSGTMDIDLRGYDLSIDLASSKVFEGRFVDSVGGGQVNVRGTGDLELRGLSTFAGLLDVGNGGTSSTPGKVIANANEVLSNNASLDLSHDTSEFDLLDHTLTIERMTGSGLFSGTTGSALTLDEIDFSGTFAGEVDLTVDALSSNSTSQRLTGVTGTLGSLTTQTNNLFIASSEIDVSGSIDLDWRESQTEKLFLITDSTLRSTGSWISFSANDVLSDGWNVSNELLISGSTLEGGGISFLGVDAPIAISDSTLRPVNDTLAPANVSFASGDVSITGSTIGGSDLPDAGLSANASHLTVTNSTIDTKRHLTISSDSSTAETVIVGSTLDTDSLSAGSRSTHAFDWQFSSLSALESEVQGDWTITASDLDFGTLTAGAGASADFQSGSITVANDLSLGYGKFLGTDLTLTGLHALDVGGTLAVDRFASLTLDGGDLTVADMTVDGVFDWIDGDLTIGGSFHVGSSSFLGTDLVLGSRQNLVVNDRLTVDYGSSLTVDGGSVQTSGIGNSTINNGTLLLKSGPVRTESLTNGGTAFIGSQLTVENQSLGTIAASNSGTIEMTGPGAILQIQNSGALSNEGLISGTGVIDGSVLNDQVTIPGRIRADLGESLRITGNLDNVGTVELVGGSVEVQGTMTNTGEVTGRGLLAGNRSAPTAIDNQATMTFSGGTSDVYGNVANSIGGTIISTGGGVVTFHDDFSNNGDEMRTSAGSSTVFLGDVTGSGAFNGSGTVYFEGTFSPGNSPGRVTATVDLSMGPSLVSTFEIGGHGQGTEHDFLDSSGKLTIDGMFHVLLYGGFMPAAGDSFDLFDAATISGSFDSITASDLSDGLEWDFSQLESDGIVAVRSTAADPFDAWASHWGLAGNQALRNADPNGDGVTNIIHFAMDSNPLNGGSDGRIRVEIVSDGADRYLTYTLPVRSGAVFNGSPAATIDGITYAITGDDDLSGTDLGVVERSPVTAGMPALRDVDGDTFPDWEYRSFRLAVPVSLQPRGFMQLTVTEAP